MNAGGRTIRGSTIDGRAWCAQCQSLGVVLRVSPDDSRSGPPVGYQGFAAQLLLSCGHTKRAIRPRPAVVKPL